MLRFRQDGADASALAVSLAAICSFVLLGLGASATAQTAGPTMVDPNLAVRTAVSGLSLPTTMAFVGPSEMLVLEKATGR